ncbi:MAG: phytoene desaturase family protein [Bacillota bacterium]
MSNKSLKHYENEYDDIIIGSGVGGLTCAAYLSKQGRKVAVFEKQPVPGGYCTSYIRDGFSFAPSVHWLSFCGEDQLVGQTVRELGISDVLKFSVFDPLVRFISKKSDITLSFDIQGMKDKLKALYPDDKKGIDDFFELCARFIKELNAMLEDSLNMVTKFDKMKFGIGYITGKYPIISKVRKVPAFEFLRRYFKNEDLIHLFYIMGPGDAEAEIFPILARIGWAIDKNYYYVSEGNNAKMAEAFALAVTNHGGSIFYNSAIKKIIVENKKAVGVIEATGKVFKAKNIISNIDGRTTYFELLGKDQLPMKFIDRIDEKIPYSSSFAVNLGVDMDLRSMGFKGESITYMPSDKLEDISGSDPSKCKIVIQFRSLRDPSLAPHGKHTVMITARIPYDYKNVWTTNGFDVRSESYYKLKDEVADQLIKSAENIIPELSKHIIVKDIATPLTFERYTGNYQGAIMGWQEKTISLPKLPVKSLYQVGHWTFPGGSINRVIACGRNAAKKILNNSTKL